MTEQLDFGWKNGRAPMSYLTSPPPPLEPTSIPPSTYPSCCHHWQCCSVEYAVHWISFPYQQHQEQLPAQQRCPSLAARGVLRLLSALFCRCPRCYPQLWRVDCRCLVRFKMGKWWKGFKIDEVIQAHNPNPQDMNRGPLAHQPVHIWKFACWWCNHTLCIWLPPHK